MSYNFVLFLSVLKFIYVGYSIYDIKNSDKGLKESLALAYVD